jgi:complex I assembly factor TIMMDC1
VSNELNATIQAGFLGVFTGALYGGFLGSRTAYMNFMQNNEATAFQSHLDAKVSGVF